MLPIPTTLADVETVRRGLSLLHTSTLAPKPDYLAEAHRPSSVLKLLEARETLSVAAAALGANRHTLKDKFTELVQKGYADLHGKGRGAHYRRVKE